MAGGRDEPLGGRDYGGWIREVGWRQRWHRRHSLLQAWGQFQETHPLIVAPICTELPFKAGTELTGNRVAAEIHGLRMTTAVNALGPPAVALPVGIADGLPQAVQVIGPLRLGAVRVRADGAPGSRGGC